MGYVEAGRLRCGNEELTNPPVADGGYTVDDVLLDVPMFGAVLPGFNGYVDAVALLGK